jgi:hypothetical protein
MSIEIKLVLQLIMLVVACVGFVYGINNATNILKTRIDNLKENVEKRMKGIEDHINECECESKLIKCEMCIEFIKKDIDRMEAK